MRSFYQLVLLKMCCATLAFFLGSPGLTASTVNQSIFDFTGRTFDQKQSIEPLEGQWLLIPDTFVDPNAHDSWARAYQLKMPGAWTQQFPNTKFISIKTTVLVAPQQDLALFAHYVSSAAKIWVNGQLIGSIGNPATEEKLELPDRGNKIFRLPPAEKYEIVIHLSSHLNNNGGIWKPILFGHREKIVDQRYSLKIIDACFFGAMLAIGIYHFFLFMIRRELISGAFALCCFAVAFRTAASNSMLLTYWFDLGWAASYRIEFLTLYLIAPAIEFFFVTFFRDDYPKKILYLRLVPYALALGTVFLNINEMTSYLWHVHINHIFTMVVAVYTLTMAFKRNRIGSHWIIFGSLFMMLFSLIDMAIAYNGYSASYVIHIGFIFFILSQSAAIARVYAKINENLMAETHMRMHSYQQLGKVFYPHQLSLMEQGTQLEHTMPTGEAQACVLCFDVIESSKIRHIEKNRTLKKYFSKCYDIMMENYRPDGMISNAYRIKEVGDGFLCSVGYPFSIPNSGNIAEHAVGLAFRFAELFERTREELDYEQPIYFSMGIALGDLQAFYPDTGAKEYDVFGKGVILATRYEAMRKQLFETLELSSIIIIQEDVYLSLPRSMRDRFKEYDLDLHNTKVRDDLSATRIFYFAFKKFCLKEDKDTDPALEAAS